MPNFLRTSFLAGLAALEKVLPLEFFELTQKDSVMYFAFAEDNRPDSPQRTETDMRFIDIRPFKRTYQIVDPDPMPGMGGGGGFKTLGELVQWQRHALNRTMQIEKRAAAGRKPDASTLDQLMAFETDLAASVRETAEGLIARGFDDVELFYRAETAMLAAVDSLSVDKWKNATLQTKDALKALIEARTNLQIQIMKNSDAARRSTDWRGRRRAAGRQVRQPFQADRACPEIGTLPTAPPTDCGSHRGRRRKSSKLNPTLGVRLESLTYGTSAFPG